MEQQLAILLNALQNSEDLPTLKEIDITTKNLLEKMANGEIDVEEASEKYITHITNK